MSRSFKKVNIVKDKKVKHNLHNKIFRRKIKVKIKIKINNLVNDAVNDTIFPLQKEVYNQYNIRDYWSFMYLEYQKFYKKTLFNKKNKLIK